jgi:hypothetical protein
MTGMSPSVVVGVAIVVMSATPVAVSAGARQPKVNPDAQLQQDFKQRIDKYMELHNKLEKQVPRLKDKAEPEEIKASQEGLSRAIRAARASAKQGEIFTPEIAKRFRQLMYPETHGPDGADTKKAMKEDAPPTASVPLKVNATYPASAPLPTVPPNVLANLPPLPEDLEYRVIGKHLLLRDVHANLIVDFIVNAIR